MASLSDKVGIVWKCLTGLAAIATFGIVAYALWPGGAFSSVYGAVQRIDAGNSWSFDRSRKFVCDFWIAADVNGQAIPAGTVYNIDVTAIVDGDETNVVQLSNHENQATITGTIIEIKNNHNQQTFIEYRCIDPLWSILVDRASS